MEELGGSGASGGGEGFHRILWFLRAFLGFVFIFWGKFFFFFFFSKGVCFVSLAPSKGCFLMVLEY